MCYLDSVLLVIYVAVEVLFMYALVLVNHHIGLIEVKVPYKSVIYVSANTRVRGMLCNMGI